MEPRNLHLHGSLAKTYGAVHRVAAATLPDALRIVDCNHPGFLHQVRRGSFHCLHGSSDLAESTEMAEHQVFLPRSGGDFHLMPVVEGGKGRTGKIIFSIVVGGALLATGVGGALAAGGLNAAGFGASAFMGISYGTVALMGAGFLLGGLNMLLTPSPKVNTAENETTSFTFNGPGNTSDEGGPIPLIYGEVVTGGVTIASSIIDNLGSGTHTNGGKGTGGTGVTTGGGRAGFSTVIAEIY